ncbi:hypothetical protein MRX96_020907 [Rhipicephalus microplus]
MDALAPWLILRSGGHIYLCSLRPAFELARTASCTPGFEHDKARCMDLYIYNPVLALCLLVKGSCCDLCGTRLFWQEGDGRCRIEAARPGGNVCRPDVERSGFAGASAGNRAFSLSARNLDAFFDS